MSLHFAGKNKGIVVGMEIVNRLLSDNGKTGIVVEYSNLAPETGSLRISDNEIHDNTAFGNRCVSRTGGTRPFRYFAKGVLPENNDIKNSGEKDIAGLCKFGTVPFGSTLDKDSLESSEQS